MARNREQNPHINKKILKGLSDMIILVSASYTMMHSEEFVGTTSQYILMGGAMFRNLFVIENNQHMNFKQNVHAE